jgi:hypothetical protein
VMAGHTHGGQLCVPGYGALVTNCHIDRSRVKGLSRWGASMALHVSAGLGTSPYACSIQLQARSHSSHPHCGPERRRRCRHRSHTAEPGGRDQPSSAGQVGKPTLC